MKRIAIFTNAFPFYPGEQFLESEIPFWGGLSVVNEVTIFPLNDSQERRDLPEKVLVDTRLKNTNGPKKYIDYLAAIFSRTFICEVTYLIFKASFSIMALKSAIHSTYITRLYKKTIEQYCKENGKIDVAYSYWNNQVSYALCLCRESGYINKVVSRLHRYDLYEDIHPKNYMPLKRQFIKSFDRLFPISEKAKKYIEKNYGVKPDLLEVCYLGVNSHSHLSKTSEKNEFSILSISSCITSKRIDKIINGLKLAAFRNPNICFKWTHIGDGILFEDLYDLANIELGKFPNVIINFKGELKNPEVIKYLDSEIVDCFINASESEGIPVSIMEAMSYGVPAIAPNVGGISELVDNKCGLLLNSCPTTEEIAEAIVTMNANAKKKEFRHRCKEKIRNKFDANTNYKRFVREVTNL